MPFIFLFNTQLLLIAIDSPLHLVVTVTSALIAMLVFAAATMGWFMARSRLWESALLLLIAFALFRPGFFWDMAFPPYEQRPAASIEKVAAALPAGGFLRFTVAGEKATGEPVTRAVVVPMGEPGSAVQRLQRAGLRVSILGSQARLAAVAFGSPAEKVGLRAGWRVLSVSVAADRPAKEWAFVPAIILLVGIGALQRRRAKAAA